MQYRDLVWSLYYSKVTQFSAHLMLGLAGFYHHCNIDGCQIVVVDGAHLYEQERYDIWEENNGS
jgi:hypothetical protein